MGVRQSQDRLWDRQVLIAIFQKDASAWTLLQSRSDWQTRRIGLSQMTVLEAAEWTGNIELVSLIRTQGRQRETASTAEACLSLDSEDMVEGKVHLPRNSPQLREW